MDKKHNVAGVLTGKKSALKFIQKSRRIRSSSFFTRNTVIWRSIRNLFLDGDLRRKNRFNGVFFNAWRKSYEWRRSSNIALFSIFLFHRLFTISFLRNQRNHFACLFTLHAIPFNINWKAQFSDFWTGCPIFIWSFYILSRCLFEPLDLISFFCSIFGDKILMTFK